LIDAKPAVAMEKFEIVGDRLAASTVNERVFERVEGLTAVIARLPAGALTAMVTCIVNESASALRPETVMPVAGSNSRVVTVSKLSPRTIRENVVPARAVTGFKVWMRGTGDSIRNVRVLDSSPLAPITLTDLSPGSAVLAALTVRVTRFGVDRSFE
jgi:hypothetical protein